MVIQSLTAEKTMLSPCDVAIGNYTLNHCNGQLTRDLNAIDRRKRIITFCNSILYLIKLYLVYYVQCTLYNLHCTVYIVHYTLLSIYCTVYISLYTVHCTSDNIRREPYSLCITYYAIRCCTLY